MPPREANGNTLSVLIVPFSSRRTSFGIGRDRAERIAALYFTIEGPE